MNGEKQCIYINALIRNKVYNCVCLENKHTRCLSSALDNIPNIQIKSNGIKKELSVFYAVFMTANYQHD